jgi:NADPH:quinone reductase-like Zn-dependent oxidoreductase
MAKPEPREGEALIRLHAAGVTLQSCFGTPRLTQSHEFSEVIAAPGKREHGFNFCDEVQGMNDWFSARATAEFCITLPQKLTAKSTSLNHEVTATVPLGALTAFAVTVGTYKGSVATESTALLN